MQNVFKYRDGLRRAGVLAAIGLFGLSAMAQQQVKFQGAHAPGYAYVDEVTATLQMPKDVAPPVPAVVILHGSAGIDGRGAFHAEALNRAGIATLEVFMFNKGQRLREGHSATLTHAYGALKYLAERPDIEPQKIGALGFSWGASLALRAASKSVHQKFFPSGQPRFAAHAPFYAPWWVHTKIANDSSNQGFGDYAEFTGAPVMLFAGGRDDYGSPEAAKEFLGALPESARGFFSLKFYPKATHGWDLPSGSGRTLFDPVAFEGKGGNVRFIPDAAVAAESRESMVNFFADTFASVKP